MSYEQGYHSALQKIAEFADQGHNYAEACEASIQGMANLDFTKVASYQDTEYLIGEQAAMAAFVKEASDISAEYDLDEVEQFDITFDMLNKLAAEAAKKSLWARGGEVLDNVNDGKNLTYTQGGDAVKQQGRNLLGAAKGLGMSGARLGRRALMGGADAGAARKYLPGAALAGAGAYGAYRLKKRYDERKKKRASFGGDDVEIAIEVLRQNGYDV